MLTHTLFCPYCDSDQVIRHGTAQGKQRYRCRACMRTFRENPGSRAYSAERKREILAAYHERTSLRGLRRIFGARAHDGGGLAEGGGRGASPPWRRAFHWRRRTRFWSSMSSK